MKLKRLFENKVPDITNPREAYDYAYGQGKRISEAEPYIMKNPEYAYKYAKDIIEDRWPEAEPYIIKGSCVWWDYYLRHFPEARTPSKDEPLMLCRFEITDVPNTITDEQAAQLLKIIEPNIIVYDVLNQVKLMRTYYRPEFKHSFENRIQQITTKQLIKDDKLRRTLIEWMFGSSNFKSDFE